MTEGVGMEDLKSGNDVLFVLLGAIMVLAMHAGFAFLELGTVRKKNQVNALVKILADFAVSTLAYFFIGYGIAYGGHFFIRAGPVGPKGRFRPVDVFFFFYFRSSDPRHCFRRHRRARPLQSATGRYLYAGR